MQLKPILEGVRSGLVHISANPPAWAPAMALKELPRGSEELSARSRLLIRAVFVAPGEFVFECCDRDMERIIPKKLKPLFVFTSASDQMSVAR